MAQIRPYRPGDEAALAEVCLRTAASGGDATGMLDDDELWANLFLLPYLEHAPELASVVESDAGEPAGYIVAAADSNAYEAWFSGIWWPRFTERWPEPDRELATLELTPQDGLLRYAYSRVPGENQFAAEYPAHMHIDLLPELQRQGFGRRLMELLMQQLRDAGSSGLHVVPLDDNPGALSFYERLGFRELAREPGIVVFGMDLT